MVERRVRASGRGQQAMMTKRSGDADGPRQQTTGGIPKRGTAEPSGVDINTPGQPPWTRSGLSFSNKPKKSIVEDEVDNFDDCQSASTN